MCRSTIDPKSLETTRRITKYPSNIREQQNQLRMWISPHGTHQQRFLRVLVSPSTTQQRTG